MMTVKEMASISGVSVRTLQFYDEIGLLPPSKLTDAGYRLYDEKKLERLQQILFFKELDFTLKEIKTIMENPQFNKAAAFQKQKDLLLIKRDRLNALLGLLDKLIRGEKCMDFKDFDLSRYFQMLDDFKTSHTDEIVERLGSIDRFDEQINELKLHEHKIAEMAVDQYGDLEHFTKAMEKNLQDYLSNSPTVPQSEVNSLIDKTEALTKKLTADRNKDISSPEVQGMIGALVDFVNECNQGIDMGKHYWSFMAENYLSNPVYIEVNDKKYGAGASKFIGLALKTYLDRQ